MKFKLPFLILILFILLFACNPQKSEERPVYKPTKEQVRYEALKTDYQLLGEWAIVNRVTQSTYDYEIYYKENEYIGVLKFDELKFETLKKEGNNFIVVGNRYGEYYKITDNNILTLFDKNGSLTEYSAITKN